ncbi:Msa family membrane protein [Staphylococcus lutrae]
MGIININLGLFVMIIGVIIIPVMINIICFKLSNEPYKIKTIFLMTLFNVFYYVIVSKSIMSNSKFYEIASRYSHEENGFYIHMNTNLLSLSQLVFISLLYFVLSFLLIRIFRKVG